MAFWFATYGKFPGAAIRHQFRKGGARITLTHFRRSVSQAIVVVVSIPGDGYCICEKYLFNVVDFPDEGLPTSPINGSRGIGVNLRCGEGFRVAVGQGPVGEKLLLFEYQGKKGVESHVQRQYVQDTMQSNGLRALVHRVKLFLFLSNRGADHRPRQGVYTVSR